MIRKLFIAVLVVAVIATENPGTAAVANALLQTEHLNSIQRNMINLLQNGSLRLFYDTYYRRPQDTLAKQIADASDRIDANAKMASGHYYPYANQISIDPNVMHRLVNIEPRRSLSTRISQLNTQNAQLDAERAAAESTYATAYANRGMNTAVVRQRVNGIEDNLHQSKLLQTHEHDYSRPFADGANMDKLLNAVRKMERVVKAPLAPNMPNAEELHAMNRLSEKLGMISKSIHQRPTEQLHQQAHAQDVMLDRAANLIRRISNSVDRTKRDNFLNAVHQELHRHHLHDHKFLNSLETEIAHAIANGTPLQMPREYSATQTPTSTLANTQTPTSTLANTQTAPRVNVQHTPETRFDVNTAVTGGHARTTNTVVNIIPGQQQNQQQVAQQTQQTSAQQTQQQQQQQQQQSLTNPAYARKVADSMENYGRGVMARSREMEHRATLAEHNNAVSSAQRRELQQHMQHRLVSPPTQVHAVGAARPVA